MGANSKCDVLNEPKCSQWKELGNTSEKTLLRTYFYKWQKMYLLRKEKRKIIDQQIEQKNKLDTLVKALKKYKKDQQSEEKSPIREKIISKSAPLPSKNCCANQKNTIQQLLVRLEAKDKIIDELKMGILDTASRNSASEARNQIREIFADCSAKTRIKLAPPPEYNESFRITTQKAPKIQQEMETRAMERARKHELILERKRIIEDTKKRIAIEVIEKKRIQDEEEKKRSLQLIKEERIKQLERDRKRNENKRIYTEKLEKAVNLYEFKLRRRGFRALRLNYLTSVKNYAKSLIHYKKSLLQKSLNQWKCFVESRYSHKYAAADLLYKYKICARVFYCLCNFREESIKLQRVAEDYNDFLVQKRTFLRWHRNVCIIIVATERKMKRAQLHYERKLLFHCFYQWRSLPAIMQLERAKDMKKQRWREKVWEILPDYKPPED